MKHSVILPIYITCEEQVTMTIQAISKARNYTKEPFELIIVETVSNEFKDFPADLYIHEPVRHSSRGVRSLNNGLHAAKGEYLTFLSNDVYVQHGWLEAMEQCFKVAEDCGAATLGTTEHGNRPEPIIREFNYWPIAMLSRKCFEDVGDNDENYVNAWSDTDYVMRMYEKGWKMYQNLSVIVHHLISQTDRKHDPKYNEIYEQNGDYFRNKFRNTPNQIVYQELCTGIIDHSRLKTYHLGGNIK